jgi:CRP-like cAMP-binding protein
VVAFSNRKSETTFAENAPAASGFRGRGFMQLDDAATILADAEFFEICNEEQRRLLAFASERKRHSPGAVIYRAGEMPEGAHVLVSGTVTTTTEVENVVPYVTGQRGAVLGAMSLIVAKPRPVTVKPVDIVETLFVPRSAFLKLANQFPDLAQRAADRIRKDLSGYVGAMEKIKPRMGQG